MRNIRTTNNLALTLLLVSCCLITVALARDPPLRPSLRSQRALASTRPPTQVTSSTSSPSPPPQPSRTAQTGAGSAVEIAPPANKPIVISQPARAVAPAVAVASATAASAAAIASSSTGINRTARTADTFQGGDGYNIFVTNTCERESMKINIKTSRSFFGLIHTKNERNKPNCRIEGHGETDFNLEISHVLNAKDPNYCGVVYPRRASPDDSDVLSVVVAIRFLPNIELSDDKFFLLNCTKRCRKPDCSSPNLPLRRAEDSDDSSSSVGEREGAPLDSTRDLNNTGTNATRTGEQDECTIWKFPWAITMLWCLGILLLAMIISHCIMCSSMVCRCVKTEVEEKEPSVYEITDNEDDAYNKRHPYRIDYDNKDIYKTSNNYEPYTLEEAQSKSRKNHSKNSSRDNYR